MREFKGIPVVGKKLSKLRNEKLFFSQEELAPLIRMSKNNLSALERQAVAGINRESFRLLADVAKVSNSELLELIGASDAELAAAGGGNGSAIPADAVIQEAIDLARTSGKQGLAEKLERLGLLLRGDQVDQRNRRSAAATDPSTARLEREKKKRRGQGE